MERLRDQADSSDPATARAARLLASMSPLDANRLRVWATPPGLLAAQRRMAPVARLRAAALGVVTFASLAAAAATAQHQGWFAMLGGHPGARNDPPTATVEMKTSAPTPAVAPATQPLAPSLEVAESVVAPVTRSNDPPSHAGPEAGRRSGEARAPRAGNAQAESVLMVEAVRALRRDGDPARAQALADEVLRRFPHGAQAEEAMILSMDASTARGDDGAARRAAARYLERFPSGRFADRARHVVAGSRDGE